MELLPQRGAIGIVAYTPLNFGLCKKCRDAPFFLTVLVQDIPASPGNRFESFQGFFEIAVIIAVKFQHARQVLNAHTVAFFG